MRSSALREANVELVLSHLAEGEAFTRAELAHLTSLTHQALGPILNGLVADQRVLERRSSRSGPGRPPVEYVLNPDGRLQVTVILRFADAIIAVFDGFGQIVIRRRIRHHAQHEPAELFGAVFRELDSMLDTISLNIERVSAIELAVEGRVDEENLLVYETPAWKPQRVDILAETTDSRPIGIPLSLTSNDRLMALSAYRRIGPDPHELVAIVMLGHDNHLFLATEGQLLNSRTGRMGALRHLPVRGNDLQCECGRAGCLGTIASGRAVVRYYAERTGHTLPAAMDVMKLISEGDRDAIWAAAEQSRALAEFLAPWFEMLDIDRLILTGAVAAPNHRGSQQLVTSFRDALRPGQVSIDIDVVQPVRAQLI